MSKKLIQKNACGDGDCESFIKPHYKVKTEEHAYELGVVLPGVSREDVDVSLEDGRLRVIGKPHREVPETWTAVREELTRGTYRLDLRLHEDIDTEAISAKVEQGILSLRLPLREQVRPRLIKVD